MSTSYSREVLVDAVRKSTSIAGVVQYLGLRYRSGAAWRTLRSAISNSGLDTSHFLGRAHNKGKENCKRKSSEQILVVTDGRYRVAPRLLRRAMIEKGLPHQCAICGMGPEWNSKRLVLQVDHLNGVWSDCRLVNLRFLCPNCHSQEDTSTLHRNYTTILCKKCNRPFRTQVSKGGTSTTEFCSRPCASSTVPHQEKGSWPSPENLRSLVWSKPVSQVALVIGVSGSAVKKRCRQLGLETPPRGYWAKLNSSIG